MAHRNTAPKPRRVTQEQLSEAEQCFAIFSDRNRMPVAELGTALRSLGINPTNAELHSLVRDIGSPSTLDYNLFMKVLSRDFPAAETPEEIREAFGVFDKDGQGYISASELKHVLTTMGDKLTQEEVDIMIREADIDGDGQIRYEQFIHMMTNM